MKKFLLFGIFLLTIVIGGGAVYFGYFLNNENLNPENVSAGQQLSPANCQDYWTKANPKLDLNMGINNDGPHVVVDYCPGEIGQTIAAKSGDLYIAVSRADIVVEIDGKTYANVNGIIDTKLYFQQGQKIAISAKINDLYGIGWINAVDDMCGKAEWGNQQPLLELYNRLDEINGAQLIETQCWGDAAKGSQDFDFDDYQILLAVVPNESADQDFENQNADNQDDQNDQNPTIVEADNQNDNPIFTSFPVIPADNNSDAPQISQCGPSSQCVNDTNCATGNSCVNVSGTNRCVANICITNRQYNNACGINLCSIEYPINVDKRAEVACIAGQEQKRVTYTVVLQNPTGNSARREKITVEDALDDRVESQFVIRRSIPYQGEYNNGMIKWNDLVIGEGGASLELTYELIVPASEYGKDYSNTISVYEDGIFRGTATIVHKIEVLPCTAIFSDKVDMIIFGSLITVFGLLLYRLSIDKKIGKLIWNIGLGNAVYKISGTENPTIVQQEKQEFEKRLRK